MPTRPPPSGLPPSPLDGSPEALAKHIVSLLGLVVGSDTCPDHLRQLVAAAKDAAGRLADQLAAQTSCLTDPRFSCVGAAVERLLHRGADDAHVSLVGCRC
jgi:hypothetical protein